MNPKSFTCTIVFTAFILVATAAVPLSPSGNQAQPQANSQGQPQAGDNSQPQSLEQPQYKLSIRSNLVLVPVIVTDKHGDHVPGLKAEDFEVREDDKPQNIVRLDEVTVGDTAKVERPATAGNTFTNEVVAEHPRKLEIIALDEINVPFVGGADGNRMLVDFLSKNVDANTLLALVALTHNGVVIIHDFSAEPSRLVAAL